MHIRHLPTHSVATPILVRVQAADILDQISRIHRFRGHRSHGRAPVSSLTELHSKPPISSNKLNPGLLQRPLQGVDRGTRDVAARLFKIDDR
jgi:hypothetical protein